MLKKVSLILYLSSTLFLLNGCLNKTQTSETASALESQVLSLDVPSNATNMRLHFNYTPFWNAKTSLDESCNIKEINQSSGTIIVNINRHCLNNGEGYDVTVNLSLNNTIYRGMSYITKNNEVRNNHIIFAVKLIADSDDDELELSSSDTDAKIEDNTLVTIPNDYEYVGKKTIDGTTVHILHLKNSKDICTVDSQCRELQKGDGLSPRPICAGAILNRYNKFIFEYACGSSM